MIYEIADLSITPDKESDFIAKAEQAIPEFKNAEGCLSMKLEQGIENPSRFLLIVGWETLEHHTETFRSSQGFQNWRNLVSEYFSSPPKVEHVKTALTGF